jgi:hypothetical protein
MASRTQIPPEYVERCKTYLTTVETNDANEKSYKNAQQTVIIVDIFNFLEDIRDKLTENGLLDGNKFVNDRNDELEEVSLEDLTPVEIVCLAHFYRLKEITTVFDDAYYYDYDSEYEYFLAHEPACCSTIDNWIEESPHVWIYNSYPYHDCNDNCCCHNRFCSDCFSDYDLFSCLRYGREFSLDTSEYTLNSHSRID